MSFPSATGGDRIARALKDRDPLRHPALVPFLTAGFPDRAVFPALLERVAAVADLVEIGVPFTDPIADGATIRRASQIAVEAGTDLSWILEIVAARDSSVPIVLMSYLNPLLAFGIDRLVREAAAAGVAGLIVPDLPLEERPLLAPATAGAGIALIPMVSPVTPSSRLRRIVAEGEGFVYAVTMTGVTGGRAAPDETLFGYLDRVREAGPLPVLAGFGIRTADQIRGVSGHADGVVIGSALMEIVESGGDPARFLRSLRLASRGEER